MQKYIRTNYDINFQHDSLRHQVLVYQPRALSNRISSEVFGVLIKFQDRWNSSLVPDLNRWLCCVPPLSLACCLGGSVNTGFRLGLLSVVRTTGHAHAEMLNVSTRSICLLRKGNRTFPSLFFASWFAIMRDYCSTNSFLMCSRFAVGWEEKKSWNQVITICDNFCLFSYLVGEPERDGALAALVTQYWVVTFTWSVAMFIYTFLTKQATFHISCQDIPEQQRWHESSRALRSSVLSDWLSCATSHTSLVIEDWRLRAHRGLVCACVHTCTSFLPPPTHTRRHHEFLKRCIFLSH